MNSSSRANSKRPSKSIKRRKVDWRDSKGNTRLHLAVINKYVDLAKIVLNYTHDINSKNKELRTPLHLAVANKDKKMVLILLDHSVDVNCCDEVGHTPLHTAIGIGDKDIALMLLERNADINCYDKNGYTPLHIAIKLRDKYVAFMLLEWNADVNCRNNEGYTPLHMAVDNNIGDITLMLLERNANVYFGDKNGLTPLHLAAALPDEAITLMLLERNNSLSENIKFVNVLNKFRNTPLHLSASYLRFTSAEILLSYGANVNAVNKYGNPPLYSAVVMAFHTGNLGLKAIKMVQLLLDSGADVNMLFSKDETPKRGKYHIHIDVLNCSYQNTLIFHLIKLRLMNQFIKPTFLKSITTNNFVLTFEKKCKAELDRMKNEKIVFTHSQIITYYCLLMKNTHQLASCLKNYNLVEIIQSKIFYKLKFPIFGIMLYYKLEKGKRRAELLKLLDNYDNILFPTLVADCVEHIFKYLNDFDIILLIDSLSDNAAVDVTKRESQL